MSDRVVKFKNVSKVYKLYEKPIDRLKESLSLIRKKYHKDFYALNNISFEIEKGETIGIIGTNGSGKSTLLKILTGVLTQTQGNVDVKGKVSALLELGTGFNVEYSGIENIYLNGTLMGLTKEEIDKKKDFIIKFADIGDFIYQPVKNYSSGMFVRLAFAVQASMDPEILIVDEALAVGDAAFSLKCMNYMRKLIKSGVTVIFVTHDIQTIRSFCNKVIWIEKGKLKSIGNPYDVTSEYTRYLFSKNENNDDDNYNQNTQIDQNTIYKDNFKYDKKNDIKYETFESSTRWGNEDIQIMGMKLMNNKNIETDVLEWGEEITIIFKIRAMKTINSFNIGCGFSFRNKNALDIITSTTIEEGKRIGPLKKDEEVYIEFNLKNILCPGEYSLILAVEDRHDSEPMYYDYIENARVFKVVSQKKVFSLVNIDIDQKIFK
ncbi:ABC transporter ATP-binding protein [Tepidibacter sp. Z1-5]|uniref:ABC transporter ATP-binding protein n=1 Tax=Tepidibacter sp. Z1-5 TaxID=3134138 RepID=UPI0030BF8B68